MKTPFTTEQFITNAKKIHGDVYTYDRVVYERSNKNVIITCRLHGDFIQRPSHHINSGHGCRECGTSSMTLKSKEPRYNMEMFISKARKIHGDRYSYDNTIFTLAVEKTEIICRIHGSFWQSPHQHMKGQGCPHCWFDILRKQNRSNLITKEEFILRANDAHPTIKYDYSKVMCDGTMNKITIICPTHGEFQQRQNTHLEGFGCRSCGNGINIREQRFLQALKTKFPTKDIQSQISPTWLGKQSFDVFIPNLNIALEYQGEQHVKSVKWFGGDKYLKKTLERDKRKHDLCVSNDIELIYFSFDTYKDESLSILPIWHDLSLLFDHLSSKFDTCDTIVPTILSISAP